MKRRSEREVIEMLRETGRRIEPGREARDFADEVLREATDVFFVADSALGPVYVGVGREGVRCLMPAASEEEFVRRYGEQFGRLVRPAMQAEPVRRAVEAALSGARAEVPLDLSPMTPFQRRVMEVVRRIPRGEVRPYGWVAREAGVPGASRAVGNVMARNPVPLLVPCHRVVRGDGTTGSYGYGADEKVRLLRLEGVPVDEVAQAPYLGTPRTGVVCHATCRNARRIRPENRRQFRSVVDATAAGYRPCKVCRPVAV
jgi:O-6-methylguanine DNA methyltransferase